MKELFGLKSFQQILFWLFLLGIIIGVFLTLYFINPDKFRFILLLPSLPVLYFISKGLYKNSNLFFMDLKSITTKS
ncbi:hypothetical protein [Flavobacterium xueshanense]|uniref:Uncharacterized protein n=1 Tax=Flavobacterium xueshanense TaxID=935223 RepID=A0A1I2FTN7_9FLAO|nr:hypothetical protein [Flavobacterium xueshanense]SFF08685.1 hypothetical protein SAMN04488131_108121 [Flavobacterium xueshanense]